MRLTVLAKKCKTSSSSGVIPVPDKASMNYAACPYSFWSYLFWSTLKVQWTLLTKPELHLSNSCTFAPRHVILQKCINHSENAFTSGIGRKLLTKKQLFLQLVVILKVKSLLHIVILLVNLINFSHKLWAPPWAFIALPLGVASRTF